MGLFSKTSNKARDLGRRLELRSVLKNDAPEGVVMYRLPEENFHNKSVLIVAPGEQAVFVRNGKVVSLIRDAGTHTLNTSNYPFLSALRSILTSGEDAYTAQVYYVRTVTSREQEFGCGLQVRDPVLKFWTDIGVQGSFRVQIVDGAAFLTNLFATGRTMISPEELQDYFKSEIRKHVKSTLVQQIEAGGEEILGIEKHLDTFSSLVHPRLNDSLEEYGLRVERFSISDMKIKKDEMRERQENLIAGGSTMGIIGEERYARIRELDILEKAANNKDGGIAATMASAGIGLQFGRKFGEALSDNTGSPQKNAPSQQGGGAFCPECGSPVGANDKFCRACGTKLT